MVGKQVKVKFKKHFYSKPEIFIGVIIKIEEEEMDIGLGTKKDINYKIKLENGQKITTSNDLLFDKYKIIELFS